MKHHIQALDGLRGTASLSVLMFHFCELIVPDVAHNPLRHAHLAVDFFFLLSGYVVGHAYDHRLSAQPAMPAGLTVRGFLLRRLARLQPMVVVSMLIAAAAYLLDPFVGDTQRLGGALSSGRFLLIVSLSLFLLPTPRLPNSFGETHSLDGPAWSLLQEYLANILYGLGGRALGLSLHLALSAIGAIALLLTAVHFGDLGHGWGWTDFWVAPLRLAYPFLTGLLIRRLGLRIALPRPFLLMSAVLIAVFTAPLFGEFNGLAEAGCVILLFPLILAAGASPRQEGGMSARLCAFLGDLSYPLYIVHYPFLSLFGHWNWTTHPGPWRLGLAVAGLYAAIVMLAWLLLRFYDRPVRAWLSRRLQGMDVKAGVDPPLLRPQQEESS